ncbi:Serine/threonine protein kinase [Trema orientale]|uniref:Serine/threonine protein kinase n=1 Tax=Trema orientale TaxID=63057 RepID=A0A2P5CKP8_TREOI|nr:Serine/threonine protein kinase [Trema orientale]
MGSVDSNDHLPPGKYYSPIKWRRLQLLGSGSYGDVYLAAGVKNLAEDGPSDLFAVKTARIEYSSSLQKELRIYNALNHCPEIVRCYGRQLTAIGGDHLLPCYNLFLEYAPSGTLSDLIYRRVVLPETNARAYTRMILRGLRHIHSKGYVHCDLKPENILVFPAGANNCDNHHESGELDTSTGGYRLKIADFGLAKEPGEVIPRDVYMLNNFRGTPIYMSPESVHGEIEAALDIWSLGCIVVHMCTGNPAWDVPTDYRNSRDLMLMLAFSDKTPRIPTFVSDDCKDFLRRCFARDPRRRWSAKMLLDHPFVRRESSVLVRHSTTTSTSTTTATTDPAAALLSSPWDFGFAFTATQVLHDHAAATTTTTKPVPVSSPPPASEPSTVSDQLSSLHLTGERPARPAPAPAPPISLPHRTQRRDTKPAVLLPPPGFGLAVTRPPRQILPPPAGSGIMAAAQPPVPPHHQTLPNLIA